MKNENPRGTFFILNWSSVPEQIRDLHEHLPPVVEKAALRAQKGLAPDPCALLTMRNVPERTPRSRTL
jgi:hypothetical protein